MKTMKFITTAVILLLIMGSNSCNLFDFRMGCKNKSVVDYDSVSRNIYDEWTPTDKSFYYANVIDGEAIFFLNHSVFQGACMQHQVKITLEAEVSNNIGFFNFPTKVTYTASTYGSEENTVSGEMALIDEINGIKHYRTIVELDFINNDSDEVYGSIGGQIRVSTPWTEDQMVGILAIEKLVSRMWFKSEYKY